MSLQKRDELVEHIIATQPSLRGFMRDLPTDISIGSWDLISYSFQRGFEAIWDLARADHSGLLLSPLLSLWRQSVELALKSAILEIAGNIENKPGHDLQKLFEQLCKISADGGLCNDDDLTRDVAAMIDLAQSFDPFADRFRYPSGKKGEPYEGLDVDLDELFQSHWIIVTWCEGTVVELREKFGIGSPQPFLRCESE